MKKKIKVPLDNPMPDADRFCRVVRMEQPVEGPPPLVELIIDRGMEKNLLENRLGRRWVEPADRESEKKYWDNKIRLWEKFGYDYIRVSGGAEFPRLRRTDYGSGRSWSEERRGIISNWEDFEKYPWPEDFRTEHYEYVAGNLPEGMGLFVCPTSGFLEVPLNDLMGYETFCYALHDDPGLVRAVVDRVGGLITGFYEKLLGLKNLRGFFQGDDMGFKTGTLVSPGFLRGCILPWHAKLARLAHENGLLYMLHSCGDLEELMEDLIEGVGIDAKHSFENSITPAPDFKKKYGARTAVLGGIDVAVLAKNTPEEVSKYTRRVLEECALGGGYALGSGNSITDYIPPENYIAMLEEGLNWEAG